MHYITLIEELLLTKSIHNIKYILPYGCPNSYNEYMSYCYECDIIVITHMVDDDC